MAQNPKQFRFVFLVSFLIQYIYLKGYTLSWGDALAKTGHKKNSFHYKGLAVDFNLFKDGEYLRDTEDHRFAGEYWKSLDPECTWGGDFKTSDGNHYSYGEH